MEIVNGDIVLSMAGRDRGRHFFVLATDGDSLILADGRMRKVETPKRKKRKHARFVARPQSKAAELIRTGGRVHSSDLRKELDELMGQSD